MNLNPKTVAAALIAAALLSATPANAQAISSLPAASTVGASDVFVGVQSGTTKKFAFSLLESSLSVLPGASEVTEPMLKCVNSPTDEYVLTYELTTGDFEWQAAAGMADADYGDVTMSGGGTALTVDADSVALGTDTTGNYAGSASEGGEANTLAPAVVIEGATADGFEGNFAFTDPTADWTWTWGATGAVSGVASITGGASGTSTLTLDGDSAVAGHIRVSANGTLGGTSGGVLLVASEILTPNVNVGSDWINLRNTGTISWDSAGGVNSGTVYGDTRLVRDYPGGAVGTLAQRSGTQAQTFRIYGTADTDRLIGTNYERLSLTCDGSADCTVAAQTAGTGADDMNLHLSGAGAGAVLVAGCKNWGLLAAPPATCDAGNECAEYSDTSHARCYCDGTTWNVLTGSGAGACS